MKSPTLGRSGGDLERSPWIKVMVEIERPKPDALEGLNRGERYRALKENAREHKAGLENWVAGEGLCEEVLHISDATTFNILFVYCTADAAKAIAHAPGVVEVMPAEEIPVDIMADPTPTGRLRANAAIHA